MEEGLKVRIGGDLSQLQATLKQAQKALKDFGKQTQEALGSVSTNTNAASKSLEKLKQVDFGEKLKDALSGIHRNIDQMAEEALKAKPAIEVLTKAEDRLGKEAIQTANEVKVLNNAVKQTAKETDKIPQSGNKATNALTNLSRVVQDAPFGFIGVANNIEPLISSFRSLAAESGGVKGALSALGGSILGGGGLVLAAGAASAGLSLLGGNLFSAKKEADDFRETIRSTAEVERDAEGSTKGKALELQALNKIVGDNSKSERERLTALQKIKDIDPDLVKGITLQSDSLKVLTSRIQDYTKALLASAIAAEYGQEIGKAAVEQAKQAQRVEEARLKVQQARIENEKTLAANSGGAIGASTAPGRVVSSNDVLAAQSQQKLAEATAKLTEENKLLTDLDVKRLSLEEGFTKAVEQSLKFTQLKTDEDKKQLEIQKQRNELDKIFRENRAKFDEDINKLNEDFQASFGKIGQDSAKAFDNGFANGSLDASLATKQAERYQLALNRLQSLGGKAPDLSYLSDIGARSEVINDAVSRLEKLQTNLKLIGETVTNALRPAFNEFFTTLLDGSKNAFSSLSEALGKMIKQLAATVLQALALSAVFTFISGGTANFGSRFFTNFGKSLGFSGAIGTNGLTGAAGNSLSVGGQFRIRGTELVALVNRTNSSNGRLF